MVEILTSAYHQLCDPLQMLFPCIQTNALWTRLVRPARMRLPMERTGLAISFYFSYYHPLSELPCWPVGARIREVKRKNGKDRRGTK